MKVSAFKKMNLKGYDLPVVIRDGKATVTNDRTSLMVNVSGLGNAKVALSQFNAVQTGVKVCHVNGYIINGTMLSPYDMDAINPNEWDKGDYLGAGRVTVEELKKVAYAMAKNDVRYYLNGVNFENGYMVATDGHRLATTSVDITMTNGTSCIVARSTIEILLLAGKVDIEVKIYKNICTFVGRDFSLVARNIDGKYPDWRRVIHKEVKLEFDFDAKKVVDDCKRIAAMQKARKEKFLSVAIDDDGSVADSNDGYMLVNPLYLIDLLKVTGNVSCYWSGMQLVARDGSGNNVIMGMRGAKK